MHTKIELTHLATVQVGKLAHEPADLKQLISAKLAHIPGVRSAHLTGFKFKDSTEQAHPAIGLYHRGNYQEILAAIEPILKVWCEENKRLVDVFDMNEQSSMQSHFRKEPPFYKRSWFRRMLNR